jgi:hypothetical protein
VSNVSVNFKVSGGELSNYIDQIQKKSDALTNSAIKSAMEQSNAAKEQLKIINEQIAAVERKNRVEAQASRSIALERRDEALKSNKSAFEAERSNVYANSNNLSDKDLKGTLGAIDAREREKSQSIKADYQDQLTIFKEQEKQAKLQTTLTREQISQAKEAAREQVKAITNGDKSLADVYREVGEEASEEEKLTIGLIEEELKQQKKKEDKDKDKDSVFSAILKSDLLRSAGNMVGNIPNAKNELDFVKPMTSMLGIAIGGALGSAIDLVTGSKFLGTGVGQTSAGVIGAELGKVAGEFIGGSLERAYQGRESLTSRNFALQALTGINYNVNGFGSKNNGLGATGRSMLTGNLSRYGLDYSQTADLEYQLAQRQGRAGNLYGGAENAIALEKGLGVSRDAIYQVIEMQRSSLEGNRDFMKTISGILKAGDKSIFKDDRTFLTEFIGKFTTLQRELLKNQGTVATGTTMDLLMKFNSIGGQFDSRDPRSMGLISSINNSLVNPNTDFKKSLSYYALRQHMGTGANIADIIQEQQKGLASETYRNSIFSLYSSFGDDGTKRLAFSDLVGGNVDAGTRLLRAYQGGKLSNGSIFGKELGGLGEGDIKSLADSQVGQYTKSTAEIQNMFVDDVSKAVQGVGVKMKDLFGSMIKELENWIVDRIKSGTSTSNKVYENNKPKPVSIGSNNKMLLHPSEYK